MLSWEFLSQIYPSATWAEGEKNFLQIVPNHLLPIDTENSCLKLFILVWNYAKFQMVSFSIFKFYPTIVLLRHKISFWILLVATSRNAIKIFHIKIIKIEVKSKTRTRLMKCWLVRSMYLDYIFNNVIFNQNLINNQYIFELISNFIFYFVWEMLWW